MLIWYIHIHPHLVHLLAELRYMYQDLTPKQITIVRKEEKKRRHDVMAHVHTFW